MKIRHPSRLYSYINNSEPKTFTATPPGGSGNWNVSFADDVWDIERSRPPGIVTDMWDTASNIITAINNGSSPAYVAAGQRYSVVICNSAGGTETLATNTGLTLVPLVSGPMTIAAGTCSRFGLLVTGIGGSAAITIVQG